MLFRSPQKLEGSVSCRDNVASMNWTSSRGGQLYTVSAVGTDGHVDKCSSFENTCDLTGLRCGQHYTAAVVANDSTCNSPPSNKVDLRTGGYTHTHTQVHTHTHRYTHTQTYRSYIR